MKVAERTVLTLDELLTVHDDKTAVVLVNTDTLKIVHHTVFHDWTCDLDILDA